MGIVQMLWTALILSSSIDDQKVIFCTASATCNSNYSGASPSLYPCTQGMVDPGDTVSRTLRKEFGEEAMNSLEATPEEKKQIEKQINELFQGGHKVRKL